MMVKKLFVNLLSAVLFIQFSAVGMESNTAHHTTQKAINLSQISDLKETYEKQEKQFNSEYKELQEQKIACRKEGAKQNRQFLGCGLLAAVVGIATWHAAKHSSSYSSEIISRLGAFGSIVLGVFSMRSLHDCANSALQEKEAMSKQTSIKQQRAALLESQILDTKKNMTDLNALLTKTIANITPVPQAKSGSIVRRNSI